MPAIVWRRASPVRRGRPLGDGPVTVPSRDSRWRTSEGSTHEQRVPGVEGRRLEGLPTQASGGRLRPVLDRRAEVPGHRRGRPGGVHATYQPDLLTARTDYDTTRKAYREARHEAALAVQDMKHQVKHLLERIRCLIEQDRVVRMPRRGLRRGPGAARVLRGAAGLLRQGGRVRRLPAEEVPQAGAPDPDLPGRGGQGEGLLHHAGGGAGRAQAAGRRRQGGHRQGQRGAR